MVESFFAQLTDKAIRRGVFHSVPELIDAIETYLAAHNDEPRAVPMDRHHRADPRQSPPRPVTLEQSPAKTETHHYSIATPTARPRPAPWRHESATVPSATGGDLLSQVAALTRWISRSRVASRGRQNSYTTDRGAATAPVLNRKR